MLGIAIVGAGSVCSVHIDSFLMQSDTCEIKVICDKYVEKAQKAIDQKGISAEACADIDAMLKRPDIDIVSICLPPNLHADITVKCLESGKHVLVEKPMASSLEECDIMIEAQKKSGKLLSVVSQNRYKIPTMKVKQMLDSNALGKVLYANINSFWWRGENYHDQAWRGVWAFEGGGSVANQSVHHLDLVQWMLGMPSTVTAAIKNVAHSNSECEDSAVAIFEYPDKLVSFSSNIVSHDEEQELVFQTQKGRVSIPWKAAASTALPNGFPKADDAALNEMRSMYDNLPAIEKEGHPAMIENFVNAVTGKEPLMIDGTEGRNALELIVAIYKAGATRLPVALPIGKDDAFYKKESMVAAMPVFNRKTKNIENVEASEISFGRNVGK